jgi:hypothetical protein
VDASGVPDFGSEAALIDDVRQRLLRKYRHVNEDEVFTVVAKAHAHFTDSRVRDFVPLLVERRATQELSRWADTVSAAQP